MKCSVNKCNRESKAKGMCNAHYLRSRYFGGTHPEKPVGAKHGRFNGRWKGGKVPSGDGRMMVMAKHHPNPNHHSGYVFLYRLMMEKKLGRKILPGEVIHHKNGIINDNRIENLELMDRAKHMNHHRKDIQSGKKGGKIV